MIDPKDLELLRCPIDRRRETPLELIDGHRVFCSRCRVQFPTRDGIINFVIDEAVLPEGCGRIAELPCQVEK